MLKGGYQIINLDGVDLRTDIGMQYEGLYEKIEGTRKPIIISGISIDGTEYHDAYVTPKVIGGSYEFDVYGYHFRVQDNDVVSVTKSLSSVSIIDLTNNYEDLSDNTISLVSGSFEREAFEKMFNGQITTIEFMFNGKDIFVLPTSVSLDDGKIYFVYDSKNYTFVFNGSTGSLRVIEG